MKNKNLIVAAMSVGLLAPLSAMAGPLLTTAQVQTFNFNTLGQSTVLHFSGFDSHLGTLHSVHFEWTTTQQITSSVSNTTDAVQNVSGVFAQSTTSFTGSGAAFQLSSPAVNLQTTPYTGSVAAGTTYSIPGLGSVVVSTKSIVGSAQQTVSGNICLSNDNSCGIGNTNLLNYIGGINLINIAIANYGTQGSSSLPNGVFTGNNGSANGSVTVYYDYTKPVPTPPALVLFGIGLLGFMGMRKKQNSALFA